MKSIPLGEFFALTNSIFWAFAVVMFKKSGLLFPPKSLNLFKITIGLLLMAVTLSFMNTEWFPNLSQREYLLLALSGILGIGIADTLFFHSLNLLGASRSAIVDCLYSPFIVFFSYLLLGEKLNPRDSVGMGLILSSLSLLSGKGWKDRIDRRTLGIGIVYGIVAMLTMAIGIVMVKPILVKLPVVWASAYRMLFGLVSLALFTTLRPQTREYWRIFRPQKAWKLIVPVCIIGSYVTMLLWVASFKYAPANIAGVLTQLSTIFTVIFANFFLNEPLTAKKMVAIVLGLCGSVLIIL